MGLGLVVLAVLAGAWPWVTPVAATTGTAAVRTIRADDEPAFVPPDFVTSWADGAFDVAVAPNGEVFTTDGSSTVTRYTATGDRLGSWPVTTPYFIAVGPDGNVWVATSFSNFYLYTPDGDLLASLLTTQIGVYSPADIAVDEENHLIVLGGIAGLAKFDTAGNKLAGSWPEVFRGRGPVTGLAYGPNGQIDVSTLNGEIVRVAANWQTAVLSFGGFTRPNELAFNAAGDEFIAEAGDRDQIAVYRDALPIGTFGGTGAEPGQFADPAGMAVSPTTGDLYVADRGNGRIQVFGDSADPTIAITNPADAATYTAGATVPADFACAPGPQGTPIQSCTGTVDDGDPVDTAGLGERTFTVTVVDELGRTAGQTVTYTVADDDPAVDLRTPADGAAYGLGQDVEVDYSCSDAGSGLATCVGDADDGTALDTSTVGTHEFTVTATDAGDNTTAVTHTYTVGGQARPDGWVRPGVLGADRGDDVYNTTGTGQTVRRSGRPGQVLTYFVTLDNDAPYPDVLRLRGRGSTPGYVVSYRSAGTDVTDEVVAGTFTTAELAPDDTVVVKVQVRVTQAAGVGAPFVGRATIRSTETGAPADRVRFIARRT